MNKAIYLGMSILDISKTLMYEFWFDYIKPKYPMDAGSFVIHIKTEDFYKGLLFFLKMNQLQMMLKNGLTRQTTMKITKDHFQQVRTKN